ncbi:MAG: T9SS type A sorting domain-containing protein [Bacteroidia bacterium]|nr:T9SS type A sorting domain-containing protein [Bacteroidia bacterium]
MRKIYQLLLLAAFVMGFELSFGQATITYSESFTNGQGSPGIQCTNWNAFRAQLVPTNCYVSMTVTGTFDAVGLTCTDPSVTAQMAAALYNLTDLYASANGHIWSLCGSRYSGEFWIDPPALCSGNNCPGPNAYILRPCIGGSNPNWGGVNTNTCGAPSQIMTLTFTLGNSFTPGVEDTIVGPTAACAGDTITYSMDTINGATGFTWSVPVGATIISGQGTNTLMVIAGGNGGTVLVQGTGSCGTTDIDSISTVYETPISGTATISGADSVCAGDSVWYSITPIAGVSSYTWTLGSGAGSIVSGQGTDQIMVVAGNTPGDLSVTAYTNCFSKALDTLSLVVSTLPTSTASIYGPSQMCAGDTISLGFPLAPSFLTYNWMVPNGSNILSGQGTDMISLELGSTAGSVILEVSNECGYANIDTAYLPIENIPSAPGTISGDNSLCINDTAVYSVTFVNGLTYNWSAPTGATVNAGQGTNQATIIFGSNDGNVSVTATNMCGTSPASDLAVTLDSCLTGLLEGLADLPAVLYPNPSNGRVKVKFTVPTGDLNMTVLTVNGQTLLTKGMGSARQGTELELDLTSLGQGIYLLKIADQTQGMVRRIEIFK